MSTTALPAGPRRYAPPVSRPAPAPPAGRGDARGEAPSSPAARAVAMQPPRISRPAGYPREVPVAPFRDARDGDRSPGLSEMVARLGPGAPLPPLAGIGGAPGVRLHEGAESRLAAAAVGSEAFTLGSHVVLGAGAEGPRREWLLAHEAAHAVQQRGAAPRAATNPEREADAFADFATHADPRAAAPELGATPEGLARKVIAKWTQSLPGDLMLILDVDDGVGSFIGGCVKQEAPHVGVKLRNTTVPGKAGLLFNLHVGFVVNAKGETCIFFYESVSRMCEMFCAASKEELKKRWEEVKEWLKEKVRQLLELVLTGVLLALAAYLAYLIAEAIVAALLLLLALAAA